MQDSITSLFAQLHVQEPNLPTPIWTQINCPNFPPRYNHTSIAINHYIITFGGNNGKNYLSDVLIFDTHKNICQEFTILNESPLKRAFHTMCQISEDQIIIYGGYSGSQVLDDFQVLKITSFDPPIGEWVNHDSEGTKPERYGHSAHISKNQMFVIAGIDKNLQQTKDIWCLDLESFSWSELDIQTTKPGRRAFHSSVVSGENIFIFGGLGAHFSLGDFWRYSMDWMRWEKFEGGSLKNFPSSRRNHTMQEIEGKIYIFGGRESTCGVRSDSLYCYDIARNKWDQLKQRSGTQAFERYNHSHVCIKGKMCVLGGQNKTRVASSEIWALEINGGSKKENAVEEGPQNKVIEIEEKKVDTRKRDDADCDVAFEVEGDIFRVHKGILETRCKYFYHMFASGMMESKMDRIKITEMNSPVFDAILEYIYEGKVGLNEELAVGLLGISDQYLLKDLRKACESYLSNCLKKETLAKRIEQAEHFGAEILKEGALRFLMDNLEEVSRYPGRDEISKETLVEVILGLQKKSQRK